MTNIAAAELFILQSTQYQLSQLSAPERAVASVISYIGGSMPVWVDDLTKILPEVLKIALPGSAGLWGIYATYKARQSKFHQESQRTAAETFRARLETMDEKYDTLIGQYQELGQHNAVCEGKVTALELQNKWQAKQINGLNASVDQLKASIERLSQR